MQSGNEDKADVWIFSSTYYDHAEKRRLGQHQGQTRAPPITALDPRRGGPRYTVKECLGRGGMGEVYRAEYVAADGKEVVQVVALKVLRPKALRLHARTFIDEVRLLSLLRHKHIARYRDFFERAAGCSGANRPQRRRRGSASAGFGRRQWGPGAQGSGGKQESRCCRCGEAGPPMASERAAAGSDSVVEAVLAG